VAYTKKISRHDKITIDGTDVSNSFRTFGMSSEHSQEDVSGFSATGYDEFLPGSTTQRFTGEAFYTEELGAIVQPLHANRTSCTITWQPDGLVDATREIYTGTGCIIFTFGPENTRGSVAVMPFEAIPTTSAGISVGNWT
jgi:hypothetical protein